MPDPAPPSPPPANPRVVLVDRAAVFIDELYDIVEGAGGLPPGGSRSTVLPSRISRKAGETQDPDAVEAEILRYNILRKASRPNAARKVPVNFRWEDPAYYPEVLDGIDLRLPENLAPAPAVNSLTIGISWPPYHHLRNHPQSAHIASSHDGLLVLYFGTGLARPWFYLVFNTRANSVAVVPPPGNGCVTPTSHCDFGGVVVQRHGYHYILAELYLRLHSQTDLASNKATLFVWSSPGFGAFDGWWVQKDVVLPLPADEDHTYSFKADMVFAVSNTSLCWVDLRTGILLCDGVSKLVGGGSKDVDFKFRFIPLPEECTIRPGCLSPLSQWSQVEEFRSMSCMNCDTIEFVSMDGGIEATLTTWTLKLHLMDDWRWEKRSVICIRDLFNDLPSIKYDLKQLRFMLSCPVISIIPDVTYLSIAPSQHKPEHEQLEAVGFHELCLDKLRERVLSMFELPSGSRIVPHSMTRIRDRPLQWREIMELRMEEEETKELRFEEKESKAGLPKESNCWQHRRLTRERRMANEEMRKLGIEEKESKCSLSKMGFQKRKLLTQKRLADVGEPNSSPSKMAECDNDVLSRTSESLRLRPTKTVGVSPCSRKEPVGLQWALWQGTNEGMTSSFGVPLRLWPILTAKTSSTVLVKRSD